MEIKDTQRVEWQIKRSKPNTNPSKQAEDEQENNDSD